MKQVSVGDGYRFEGLGTNKSELVVLWSLKGQACPHIRVDVENCASPLGLATLQVHVPPELFVQCPGLQVVVKELSSAVPAEHPGGQRRSPPTAGLPPLIAAVAELGAAWVVFAVLLFDRDLLASESRAQKLSLLGLFFFSLLLHWSLSSGGPGDPHLNLGGIWSSGLELRWGPAPIALFRLLALVLGEIRDTHIFWCNLILSSLLPVVLYEIVSELGVGKVAALLAAFVTAAHPLLIAFSGVLERQPAYLFAAAGSTLALIGFLKRGRWGRFIAFVLGAVLAATSRPEGVHALILFLAVLLLVPAHWWARGAVALALALLIPFAFAYVYYVLDTTPDLKPFTGHFPFLQTILCSPDFTPAAWIVAWMLGLVLGLRRRAAWIALLTLLGLDIVWKWAGIYRMFVGHERQVASARYETILLFPFVIGVALLIQALLKVRPSLKVGLAAAFLAFTAMTFRRPYETLLKPFTIDYEYHFLKKYALTLPPHARLYILDSPLDDIGFLDAHLVGQFVGSAVSFGVWSSRHCDDLLGDPSWTYLYIGSSCAELIEAPGSRLLSPDYADWMQVCASIRARIDGNAVEEIDVPAHKMTWQDFKESSVRLALYRLNDPSICALGPRS